VHRFNAPRCARTSGTAYAAAAFLLATLLVAAGCSSGSSGPPSGLPSSAPTSDRSSPAVTPSETGTSTKTVGRPSKLLVVVMENHSLRNAMSGMPTLAAAAARYGVATQSYGMTHPSLPNYLSIAGGSTFGVHDDNLPVKHPLQGPSVFGQVLAAGKVAKTYAEGMTSNCQLRSGGGRYAVKHNPWPYFVSPAERAGCLRYDVPAGTPASGALHDDIAAGTMPTFGLLIPDLCNDAHDCSLSTADGWLHTWLGPLLAGRDFRSGRLAIVVTFDEDHKDANNNILTAVLHARLHGTKVAVRLTHDALSHSVSRLVGAPPLRNAATAPDLLAAFGLAPPK
jgi:hypothetical protein